jgi:nucleotide-binding universal stress UspA family protein
VHLTGQDPSRTLLTAAEGSDLVVLGNRGHHRRHLGVGRVAMRLAEAASCDVVVVRGRPEAVRCAFRRIVALVSMEERDDAVLLRAREIAKKIRSKLRAVCACPTGAAATGTAVRVDVDQHPPHEVIASVNDSDLVVVGHGAGQLGLVTRAALHHAPCPVLIVRSH